MCLFYNTCISMQPEGVPEEYCQTGLIALSDENPMWMEEFKPKLPLSGLVPGSQRITFKATGNTFVVE